MHDAVLIEAGAEEIDEAVEGMQSAMREASELVLGTFTLRSDAKVVRHPDRYMDPRGEEFWRVVIGILAEL